MRFLAALLLSLQAAFGLGSHAPQFSGDFIDAYAGVNVTNWNMTYSLSDSIANSTGDDDDRRYDTNVDPFVLRVFDIKFKNVYGFELGLNYLTESLLGFLGFSSTEDVTTTEERVARQLQLYANRYLGDDFALMVDLKWRKFAGTVDVVNIDSSANSPVINFYGLNDVYKQLNAGDQITWSTNAREFALLAIFGPKDSIMRGYLGYRHFLHSSPAEVSISRPSDIISSIVTYDALMITDISIHTLEGGLDLNFQEGPVGFAVNIPVNLGWYSYNNDYFDSPSSFITMLPVDANVSFGGRNWRAVLGFYFNYMFSVSINGEAELKKALPYRTNQGSGTLPTGTTVELFTLRTETFWGPYFSFAYSF